MECSVWESERVVRESCLRDVQSNVSNTTKAKSFCLPSSMSLRLCRWLLLMLWLHWTRPSSADPSTERHTAVLSRKPGALRPHKPPQWGAVDAEIKVPSGENTELKRSPLKPGSGQYIAIHATLTARDFFLAYFYPSGPITCIFSKFFPDFFPVLAVANTGSCVGLQNNIGHPP